VQHLDFACGCGYRERNADCQRERGQCSHGHALFHDLLHVILDILSVVVWTTAARAKPAPTIITFPL
jgi:hypothetical protein